MTNFIEEFYYGNLDPQARSTLDYLKQHRRGTLTHLQMECKLNSHLYDINFQTSGVNHRTTQIR